MSYQVSEKIQNKLDALTANENVKKALKFMEDDHEVIIEKQCELTLIPAPTGQEEQKALRMLEMFKEEGLEDCHIDEHGNCVGIRKGTGGGKTVLIEGHMDTVFPMDTKLEIIKKDGYIYCPGICDDTRGCAVLISTVRALNAAGIQTKGDIHFVGTVKEEGTGDLMGMKTYCKDHPELDASISVDGPFIKKVTYEATGLKTTEVTFHGIGGHSSGMYGKVANPLHAASRAVTKIAEFRVPSDPMTTVAVTNFLAGSYEAVHAIVPEATIRFNFRSNSQAELDKLEARIMEAIEEACKEETERWGKDTITYTVKPILNTLACNQSPHAPIVEAAMAIIKYQGEEPVLGNGGSTNCNAALAAGLPAVCLGIESDDDYNHKCHTLEEKFNPDGAYKGAQQTMLLALLCAGTEIEDSIIE